MQGKNRRQRLARRDSAPPDSTPQQTAERRADLPPVDELDIAVRAYAEQSGKRARSSSKRRSSPPSIWTLIFDTETTTDASQRLRFGTYEVRKRDKCAERGIFYVPDDPKALSSDDIIVIRKYARENKLRLWMVRDFVDEVFYGVGYDFRATIVGFNLPFDISRLAIDHSAARAVTFTSQDDPSIKITNRSMVGGFTFKLSEQLRPRVRIKHRSSKDAFFQFVNMKRGGWSRRGFFIDVKTIAAALLGKPFTLKSLAEELGVEHRKLKVEKHGGPVTPEYLDYAVRDTVATWDCYRVLRDRFTAYGLTKTPLNTLHTEASVGKAHLKEMGIKSWFDAPPDFPRELLGAVMCSYFGGRSEVHIRRKITRVLYCDFLSMYPTVSVLMGLWSWVRAEGVTPILATDEITTLLDNVTLDDLRKPEFWPRLTALVQIEPTADILPVRAKYAVGDEQYRLALNHLTSKTPLWFTLADCIASKFLTGRSPKVLQAYRFQPGPVQQELQSINIAGNPHYRVNPASEDFYKRLIDLRREIQTRAKNAPAAQKPVLEHEQLAVKNVANATTYGIFIELNVEDQPNAIGTCYGAEGAFPIEANRFEQLGVFFHPLVAVFTTGAARLMLATAERLAISAGINWAFCDTDSMALAKPDDMPEGEFLSKAESVRDWFTPLNPYSVKGPVFKIEEENYGLYGAAVTGEMEPLYCYAISPKRYVLFNIDEEGRPVIRKALAHGLGHLCSPTDKDRIPPSIPKPAIPLAKMDVRAWQYCLWYRIVEAALAGSSDAPRIADLPGLKRPAATQYTASTPLILDWCKGYNRERDYPDKIKPFNFMLRFYAELLIGGHAIDADDDAPTYKPRFGAEKTLRPIAPFDKDPGIAAQYCFDRATGEPIAPQQLSTYAQELAQYHLHPDSKFLGAEYFDSGVTQRRHVFAANVQHIGKEADHLEEQLELGTDPDALLEYGTGTDGARMSLEQLRSELKTVNLSRLSIASVVSRQRLADIRDGKKSPKRTTLKKIMLGIQRVAADEQVHVAEVDALLAMARSERYRIGLREFARRLRYDHSTIAQVLDAGRTPSARLLLILDQLEGSQ
jgi:hypothetical protein